MKTQRKSSPLSLCALFLALLTGCQQAAQPVNRQSATQPTATRRGSIPSASGQFDYYLLTLSWAPEYCHGHPNSPECDGSHRGFVVHGLWPQFQNGRWPSDCSSAPGLADPSTMLDIMPDPRLIAHEWQKHGTCTGLTANQYFGVVRSAYASIKIPRSLINPARTTQRGATEIKQLFASANPGISADGMAIRCHNRYLAGVEFCLGKSLRPVSCQGVRDCDQPSIRIPAAP